MFSLFNVQRLSSLKMCLLMQYQNRCARSEQHCHDKSDRPFHYSVFVIENNLRCVNLERHLLIYDTYSTTIKWLYSFLSEMSENIRKLNQSECCIQFYACNYLANERKKNKQTHKR